MSDSSDAGDGADASKGKLYEDKNESKKKIIRLLTVMAYVSSVSMAAVMLSMYYIFLWDPKVPQHLTMPQGPLALQDGPRYERFQDRDDYQPDHVYLDTWRPAPPIPSLSLVREEKADLKDIHEDKTGTSAGLLGRLYSVATSSTTAAPLAGYKPTTILQKLLKLPPTTAPPPKPTVLTLTPQTSFVIDGTSSVLKSAILVVEPTRTSPTSTDGTLPSEGKGSETPRPMTSYTPIVFKLASFHVSTEQTTSEETSTSPDEIGVTSQAPEEVRGARTTDSSTSNDQEKGRPAQAD